MLTLRLYSASREPSKGALINMTDWITFFAMDVIGDLALGESFHMLETGEYHDWVRTLFKYVQLITIAAAPRYYSVKATEFVIQHLMPRIVSDQQKTHKRYSDEMINRRLDSQAERPDFMTPFMKNNVDYKMMSKEEIFSNFSFIILGGSETTAAVSIGLINHLCRNPHIRARLTNEIRDCFLSEKDINLDTLNDAASSLPYLEAVIQEALRMCSPIPTGLPRKVPPGGDTYCGVFLPAGVSPYSPLPFPTPHPNLPPRPASASRPTQSTTLRPTSTTPTPSTQSVGSPLPPGHPNSQTTTCPPADPLEWVSRRV